MILNYAIWFQTANYGRGTLVVSLLQALSITTNHVWQPWCLSQNVVASSPWKSMLQPNKNKIQGPGWYPTELSLLPCVSWGSALLMLKWGGAFLNSETHKREFLVEGEDPFLQSQEETLKSKLEKIVLSFCCWDLLSLVCMFCPFSMMNYHDNPVTNVGRNPDVNIVTRGINTKR